ncbi:MAG TPA: DUF5924 family protein [Methylomirabilota bacterium]|nr:DUF5924 family protein [Methylomirabilota bacterium]
MRWLLRWGVSIGSLAMGLVALFVFRRGLPHVGWIVGYLLLLWLLFVVLAEVRAPLEERGRRLVVSVAHYTIQSLYHNLLLFVLPGYYAAATLTSANALFLIVVALGALVTSVDPWYQRLVHSRPWLDHALFGFSMFAALNVALPLVGVRPILALEASAALAVLALTPAFRHTGATSWKRAHAWAVGFALVAVVLAWYGRALVPPAPLFLAYAVPARAVTQLEPVDPVVGGSVPAARVVEWGGIAAYTAIYAPAGLRQAIEHVWYRDGKLLARIQLATPVRGGRTKGFRTYSRNEDLRPPLAGRYTVDVRTASGQLIGRLSFTVTP